MAALDDILGGSGYSGTRKPIQVSPPPIDPTLHDASNSMGSQSEAQYAQKPALVGPTIRTNGPLTDATQIVGKPGEAPKGSLAKVDMNSTSEESEEAAPHRMSYVEMYRLFNPDEPETEKEKAEREKREKREAFFAALGDGISALSNLWFTSQYAPNGYDASKGMSASTRERWDKLRKEREAKRRAYYDGYVRAMAMDEAKEREERNYEHTLEREKITDKRYEVQEERDKALADLNEQLKRHEITAAEANAEQKRIVAQFAKGTEELKQENLRAGVQQKKAAAGASYASANASNARANYYRSGGGGGGKHGPTLQLENDGPMHFGDDKDYDRAVMRLAPDYGVPTTTVEVTERDSKGRPKKQRTVKRDVKDIAADIEREAAKRKKANQQNNTMPGVGGKGGSTNTMPGVK